MRNTGLILEGGGMRGLYTAGALDLFLDENITFPTVYGVSAGACHACSFLSGQRGRAYHAVADYANNWRYMSFRSLLLTGDFFGEKMAYHEIPDKLLPYDYDALRRQKAIFYAAVTDIERGQAEYLRIADLERDMDILRASSSLPLLSRNVVLNGKKYLDGGIADSIPLARSIADGNDKNLVILTQHRGYRKKADSMLPLMRLRYRKYPAFVRSMETRHEQYNRALALVYEREQRGMALVLQPGEPVGFGRIERDEKKLKALYDQGYADAKARIGAIRAFLSE